MNKKGFYHIGGGAILLVLVFFLVYLIVSVSAIDLEKEYFLGEKIKINLEEPSRVRIQTPTDTFVYNVEQDFVYEPKEVGSYRISVGGEVFDFEVIGGVIVEPKTILPDLGKEEKVVIDVPNENLEITEEFGEDLIRVGEEVRREDRYKLTEFREEFRTKVPRASQNLRVYVDGKEIVYELDKDFFDSIISLFSGEVEEEVVLDNVLGDVKIVYDLPGPEQEEIEVGDDTKKVKVFAPDVFGYEDVIAGTNLPKGVTDSSSVKIYWEEQEIYLDHKLYDQDSDGIYDYVEWIVPHLSEQNFAIIIEITGAEHLDSNRTFLDNVYSEVSVLDDVFASVGADEYLRVLFERNLSNVNDITIYAKSDDGASVEVYEKDSDVKIADFGTISENKKYRILLSELFGVQDTFDLKVVGGNVLFDYVIDPTDTFSPSSFSDDGAKWSSETNAYADGSGYATTTSSDKTLTLSGYGFSYTSDYTIDSVRVRTDYYVSTSNEWIEFLVSWDGGSTWSAAQTIPHAGSETTNWTNITGLTTWTYDKLNDTNFRVRYNPKKTGPSGTWYLDWAPVEVIYTYTPPAGSLAVTLNTPIDTYNSSSRDMVFNFTTVSTGPFVNCSLWDNSTGSWHLNQSNITSINNDSINFLNKTYLEDGTFLWNVECWNSTTGAFAINNRTFTIDTIDPFIDLVAPVDNYNETSYFGTNFIFNVTDTSPIANCSLIVDGSIEQTNSSIVKNANTTFTTGLSNGIHTWNVNCTDFAGNINSSAIRTINVSVPLYPWAQRLYESSSSSYTDFGNINLNVTRDGSQNSVTSTVPAASLMTIVNATSPFVGGNGVLLEGPYVNFSGVFTSGSANKGYITWKAYITNSSGDYLLCQAGDDSGSDPPSTQITNTGSTTYASGCINSADRFLASTDRIKLVINVYNSWSQALGIGHYWDGASDLSYVQFTNLTSAGILFADLTYPTSPQVVDTTNPFNVSCAINCSDGFCYNTNVSVQYNTSIDSWTDVGSSGNIVLNTGETNSHSLGTVGGTVYENFTLIGNTDSVNNVRCVAVSDYSDYNGTTTEQITVSAANEAPDVNLTNPQNGYWNNTGTINFYYNVSDDGNSYDNCSLYLDGVYNMTNQSVILDGQENNFTVTGISEGQHNWTVYCYDTAGLNGTDSTRNFYVDLTDPYSIDLVYPGDDDVVYSSSVNFNFSVSDNLGDPLICNLTVDGSVVDPNFAAGNGSYTNRTISGLTIQDHLWNVTCWDNATNINTSATYNFSVVDLPPTVLLTDPINFWWFNSSDFNLSYNVSENNAIDNCSLYIDGAFNRSNSTPVFNNQINNFSISGFSDGTYTWTVYCYDDAGFNGTDTARTFYLDTEAPKVNLYLPDNDTTVNVSSLNFNFTTTDNMFDPMWCNLTINGEVIGGDQFLAFNGSLTEQSASGLSDGPNYWNVTCIDEAKNINTSITRLLNITDYPSIVLNTGNESTFNESPVTLTYTPSDNMDLANCSLYLNGAYNQSNQTTITNGAQNTFSVATGSGSYTWYVMCEDTYGLQNSSEIRVFDVDLDYPTIQLYYPGQESTLYGSLIPFNFTVTDGYDDLLSCDLRVNGIIENSTSSASNGTNTTLYVSFSEGGIKYWNVTCEDDGENINVSETWNFTLYIPPVVNLTSPDDGNWFNVGDVNLSYNVSDGNDNLINASLYLNGAYDQSNQTPILNNQINNFSLTGLADGTYTWNVNVSDAEELSGIGTLRTFYVDTITPLVTLYYPLQGNISTTNNVTLNFSVSDASDGSMMCNVSFYETGQDPYDQFPNVVAANNSYIVNYLSRSDGNYTWNVTCYDEAGNYNTSQVVNFSIIAPPNVTLDSPPDNNYTGLSDITFYYTPYDAVGISNCSIYLDGVLNDSDDTINHNEQNSFLIQGIIEGQHNWTVNCTDVDENTDQPTERDLFVDNTAPNIVLNNPGNDSGIYYDGDYILDWTATDLLDSSVWCDLYVNGSIVDPNILMSSGIPQQELVGFPLGYHNWSATCRDRVGNSNDSLVYFFNFTYPDFVVNETLISFNTTSPSEGTSVGINVTIYNLGGADMSGVVVRAYDGDPDSGGVQIGSSNTINLSKWGINYTLFTWSADVGTSQIYTVVDPPIATNGSYDEWNESNNKGYKNITVGAWQYFYGDIDLESEFRLADASDYVVVVWNATNFNGGNIYIADYDAGVSWGSLFGLGRTSGGAAASADFSEADTNLNMTGFNDSIYDLYTTGGTPDNLSNYTIFSRVVYYVPEAQSINNSNFFTGILWDSDDDSDSEYDSSEDEDLIFVSTVKNNVVGSFGTYDYEIRVPANLAGYSGPDSASAIFYVELV